MIVEKTYTEREIKAWFENMRKKYKNRHVVEELNTIENMMFNRITDNTLERFKLKNEVVL